MLKLKLILIILISAVKTHAQYYPNLSDMSFYNQYSGQQDLHYNDGWERDTNSINLENSIFEIKIANGTTHYLQTGFLNLKKDEVISFDHRITNMSGIGILQVSYIDTVGNIINIKTIAYNSSNTLNDTIIVNNDSKSRIRFTYTLNGSNQSAYFVIKTFSVIGLIPLTIKPNLQRVKKQFEIIEDEVLIYNIYGVCVYEGYLLDFYKVATKGQMYFTNKTKFIIQ